MSDLVSGIARESTVTHTKIKIPGFKEVDGETPIVIVGPNGSGKTQLAQKIAKTNPVSAISAQRRTWVNDRLPVQEEQQLRAEIRGQIEAWHRCAWQETTEIDWVLSDLIGEHASTLTKKNDEAIALGRPGDPVTDTKLMRIQGLWKNLFPKRKLEIDGFFPKVKRLDVSDATPSYLLLQMSDGERTVLYMAARVMTADQPIILVDEPELHMHSRLAVQFWDEAEKMRSDCRFVYITHDLSFALSRRRATFLIARSNDTAKEVPVERVASSIAAEVLGVATLPFYARRIILYEGESGRGFASEFFSAWFDDDETFAIPCGGLDSVCAAVSGLKTVGVTVEVIGLIDRDYYPDDFLNKVTEGVKVLSLHEVESVLCDQRAVSYLAEHLGNNPGEKWDEFLDRVRKEFQGQTLNSTVARRVRSRVGDLLKGAFKGEQIVPDPAQTCASHCKALAELNLPAKTQEMFTEEFNRVADALNGGGTEMLAILPGKHLLSILADVLGFSDSAQLTGLAIKSLNRKHLKNGDPLLILGQKLETALLLYLPPRRTAVLV